MKTQIDLKAHFQSWAHKITFQVHRADQEHKGPFIDDEDYQAYLFNVKRSLLEFFEETQKLMTPKRS